MAEQSFISPVAPEPKRAKRHSDMAQQRASKRPKIPESSMYLPGEGFNIKFFLTQTGVLELIPDKGLACFLPASTELKQGQVLAAIPGSGASADLAMFRHLLLLLSWSDDKWRRDYTGVVLTIRESSEENAAILGWLLYVQAPDHEVKVSDDSGARGQQPGEDAGDAEPATEYVSLPRQIVKNAQEFYDAACYSQTGTYWKDGNKRGRTGQGGGRPVVQFDGILPELYATGYPLDTEVSSIYRFADLAAHILPWVVYESHSEFTVFDLMRCYSIANASQRIQLFLEHRGFHDHPVLDFLEDLCQGAHNSLNVPQSMADGAFDVYHCMPFVRNLANCFTTRLPLAYGLPTDTMQMVRYCNGIAAVSHRNAWKLDPRLSRLDVEYACFGETYRPKPANVDRHLEDHPKISATVPFYVTRFDQMSGTSENNFLENLKGPGLINDDQLPLQEIQQSISEAIKDFIGKPKTPQGVSATWSVLQTSAIDMINNNINPRNILETILERMLVRLYP